MAPNLPSSFASAAAGQSNRDARSGSRGDGRANASGEWPRPSRTMNGTLTFRRTSATPSSQAFAQPNSSESGGAADDPAVLAAMPVNSTAIENLAPRRYSREELLAINHDMLRNPSLQLPEVSALFVAGWSPGHPNGASSRGWGKPADSNALPQEPDICWETQGLTKAIGLQEMSTEEKELFSDVNSTMKPPVQNKEGVHATGGVNGRKTSVTQATSNNYGLSSPSTTSRPGTRRRETTDTNPFSGGGGGVNSPISNRPTREGNSLWFDRRATDTKDSMYEEPEEDLTPGAVGAKSGSVAGISRSNTATSATGAFPTSSVWQTSSTLPGLGSFGNFALPVSTIGEKRPVNQRGESRLAHLLPRDSSDNMTSKPGENSAASDPNRAWRPRPRTDTDPFGDETLSGSAVLGGAQDTSPPPLSHPPLHASFDTPVKGSAGDFGMAGLNLGGHGDHDPTPLSPSETNPYRSPPGDRGEHDEGLERPHGFGVEHATNYGTGLGRSFAHNAFDGSDRSQTSSVGAKAYPTLGNLSGWPSSSTPDRERAPFAAFGGSLFGQVGDMQSPGLGNLGGVFGPASGGGLTGSGSFSRGSKLGSLFPAAMQAQMQTHETENLSDSIPDLRQSNPLGAIGRNPLNDPTRETESPMRAGRGVFAGMFAAPGEQSRTPTTAEPILHGGISAAPGQSFPATSSTPHYSGVPPSEPPSAQARTMVMPDRMRWTYLDPQGNVQGPFTGLEMNDWYKANFFTPDLRVKKVEDLEFEPLGQLIRRIGNSREPFLVPQIGIPHGPPAQSGPFSPNASGVIQPPLVGAFPSFGRTLTAEEQNNLERRKQEEQYLMARQREYLTNQQAMGRMPMQGVPGLNHHSSAHSLHSQPSFGSMTSPMNVPPQPPTQAPIGPIGTVGTGGSFFDSLATRQPAAHGNSGPGLDVFREDELTRLTGTERQVLASMHNQGALGGSAPQQNIDIPSPESNERSQLPAASDLVEDSEGFRDRLQEFKQLRAQHDAEAMEQNHELSSAQQAPNQADHPNDASDRPHVADRSTESDAAKQKNASATSNKEFKEYQQAQAAAAAAKLSGLPMPFPPPPSGTPLPAPAPQRIRSNLPDQYAASSRSGTPDVSSATSAQVPPLAPWAKDGSAESHKGPSLKEIQQAEALKAAQAEEAAALARRAMLEQEAAREREKAAAAAPGLPTSSTWGAASPVSAGPVSSPWVKPVTGKAAAPTSSTPSAASDKKKTLAEIQREEEARKQKARELAAQTGQAAAAGKRYADLASKTSSTPLPSPGGAINAAGAAVTPSGWATVGAGGKVKMPPAGPPAPVRSSSTTGLKPTPSAAAPSPRPALKSSASTTGGGRQEAMEEFNKWLQSQLIRGITGVTDIDTFASTLVAFPLIPDIISDAIYANSKTMDGRHFAQEFIRRKKLAEKGVVEKQPINSPSTDAQASSAGGWNEVAKKSSHKDTAAEANPIQAAGFKVVPSRKKGKK
ncbi:hypothetical protein GGS20DRAFT_554275 [Poronia punctata]|nr:hypothetical protein GGS20DRAFT_554275 [Poronia punctata]